MTKLDFPDTPTTGQEYGSSGTVWRWDGTRWGSTAGAAGARGRVAYAQINASQGGITSAAVDIAGLSVTWTADPSRTYRTTILLHLESTVATDTLRGSIHDGAGVGKQYCYTYAGAVSKAQTQTVSVIESGISGSTTRKVQVYRQSGTGTLNCAASAVLPAFILVEDITYEAGSGAGAQPVLPPAYAELRGGIPLANNSGTSVILNAWASLALGTPGVYLGSGIFTAPAGYAGRWYFSYSFRWDGNINNDRQSWMFKNGTARYGQVISKSGSAGVPTINCGSAFLNMAVGDQVTCAAYQNSGAILNVAGSGEDYFQGTYLGPL